MSAVRPNSLLNLMLAAGVLVGSVASTPTFGHAHPVSGPLHHVHHDLDAIDHSNWSHFHQEASDDHDDHAAIILCESVFHLHSVWFGVPFTLPAPAGHQNQQAGRVSLADACWTSGATAVSTNGAAVRERGVWDDVSALTIDRDGAIPLSTNSLCTSALCGEVEPPCALPARSGVLRC